jgi:hypothetical protein
VVRWRRWQGYRAGGRATKNARIPAIPGSLQSGALGPGEATMKICFVMLAAVLLSGCAGGSLAGNDAHIYPGFFGQNVVGNETYVTVSNVYNEMDALPLAERHCAKFGKAARFNHMERIRAIFDCVPKQRS